MDREFYLNLRRQYQEKWHRPVPRVRTVIQWSSVKRAALPPHIRERHLPTMRRNQRIRAAEAFERRHGYPIEEQWTTKALLLEWDRFLTKRLDDADLQPPSQPDPPALDEDEEPFPFDWEVPAVHV